MPLFGTVSTLLPILVSAIIGESTRYVALKQRPARSRYTVLISEYDYGTRYHIASSCTDILLAGCGNLLSTRELSIALQPPHRKSHLNIDYLDTPKYRRRH